MFIYKKVGGRFQAAVTVAGLLNIAQCLIDVELDPTSWALKYLFNPLPDDISGLRERCCYLTWWEDSLFQRKAGISILCFVLH